MSGIRFILGIVITSFFAIPAAFAVSENTFQDRIDSAYRKILSTEVGLSICNNILNADAKMLVFHLGISQGAAQQLASDCKGATPGPYVFPTDAQEIRKLTLKPDAKSRKYLLSPSPITFPIESWTEPFTNTTVFLGDEDDLSEERLVQLLAHETAVYFDSKANPAHQDAKKIPRLRDTFRSLNTTGGRGMDPLVAASDPLIAHSLTYIRALQVEYAIVRELVNRGAIRAPLDYADPYLNSLVAETCRESCLEDLIVKLQPVYAPISLPLLAFAPNFRSLLSQEVARLQPKWDRVQWARFQFSVNQSPASFFNGPFTGQPVADLQRVFGSNVQASGEFQTVRQFLREDMWPLEWPALTHTQLSNGQPLLEFLKAPLLSGYNISLSSGPRIRVRTGNSE